MALTGEVLLTGNTRGIGRDLAPLCELGASVIANYLRDQKAADGLKATAEGAGLPIRLCGADATTLQPGASRCINSRSASGEVFAP